MTAISEKDKTDYLKQIVSVQLSLQKLERTYSRVLFTTILMVIGLASWYIWLGVHNSSPAKQPNSKAEITSTKHKPTASH